ncbi:MAG: hypothetical protein P9M15_02925 [Candidatus Electryoneaceae bacterium]|nr:hypothetical protein [Candidatus Electryoneaceae bacterium]
MRDNRMVINVNRIFRPHHARSFGLGLVLLLALVVALVVALWLVGCGDERTAPTEPVQPSYTATIPLFDRITAEGSDNSATFSLRDELSTGRLYMYGLLRPDDALLTFRLLGTEIDSIEEVILGLDGQILELELKSEKTHEDSVRLDELHLGKAVEETEIFDREICIDSLDTRLDDRYKISVWMDTDTVEYYPQAVFLDSSVAPYLGADLAVWGQGFYLSEQDANGWCGMRMILDLSELLVADAGWETDDPYIPPSKPNRGSTLPELFPITDWLDRLTPDASHTIHIRFGESGTETELTASLYVVYMTAG